MPRFEGITPRAARVLRAGAALFWATCATATGALAQPEAAPAPARVVSTNLCTDQLAMMLADEEQLLSVSQISRDPRVSAMVAQAKDYKVNHGRAEEIYLMAPDLVLAGRHTSRATTAMLDRLGIEVAVFPIATSLADVRALILRMGEVLHRQEAARRMLADFDARLARLRQQAGARPEAVIYHANGYTSGDRTLAGQILATAGFANAAARAGYTAGTKMPLEVLAMTAPDVVVTSQRYPGGSRAEEILGHPVVQAFRQGRDRAAMSDADWVCGTPFVLRAIEELAQTRRRLTGGTE